MRTATLLLGLTVIISSAACDESALQAPRYAVVDHPRAPKVVRFPAPEFASVQDAVNAVADGGTIFIGPGTHKATVDVVGKSIRFFGERNATTLVAGDGSRSVLRFGAGGGGEVRDLTIQGGTASIEGTSKLGALRPLIIRGVIAGSAAAAVAGQFGELEIYDSRFEKISQSAINVTEVIRLIVSSVFTANAHCFGLLVFNTNVRPRSIIVRDSEFGLNGCGGIGIWGSAAAVEIDDVYLPLNNVGGIILVQVGNATITDVHVLGTQPDDNDRWGDAILLWGSSANISRSLLDLNRRAGVSLQSCLEYGLRAEATISRTQFILNPIDIAVTETEPGCTVDFDLNDGGRNFCSAGPCRASVTQVQPLPPPEPVRH